MTLRRFEFRRVLACRTGAACLVSLVVGAVTLLAASQAVAKNQPSCVCSHTASVRPQDQLVLINSRPIGCTTDDHQIAAGLKAAHYIPGGAANGGNWVETPWQEVVSWNEPGVATVIYVHGNRISPSDAINRGLYVYSRFVRYGDDQKPLRFIMWSWPSTQIDGFLRDYRVKAARTRPVGYQLAWLVCQLPPEMPIGFLGYSYGARVESGAAHLLAGGSLSGLKLNPPPAFKRPTEHVYMAPAFDESWLSPRRYHGKALERIDHVLTTVNNRDPAMRFYPLLYKQLKEHAMGFKGPRFLPRHYSSRVQVFNVSQSVGRSHDLYDYVRTPGLMAKAWRRLTFADRALQANMQTPNAPSLHAQTSVASSTPAPTH